MARWFRFYSEVVNDPKVQKLPCEDFRAWVNLLCLAAENDGRLPSFEDIAFALRMDDNGVRTLVERLLNGGLIDRVNGGANGYHYAPHAWSKRQYKSDTSTDRVKRFRQRSETVTVTPPETEADTEQIIEAKASCPAKPNAVDSVFSEAWKAYPPKGRERSKSQAKTLPIWKDSAKRAGGPDRLLAAVKRYVAQDQTHKGDCGPPAFDRWLRDGRWEHWLPPDGQTSQSAVVTEISPELRARRLALLNGDTDDQQDHAQASADR